MPRRLSPHADRQGAQGGGGGVQAQRDAAAAVTIADWDEDGVTIQPAGAIVERIPWAELEAFKENERIVLCSSKKRRHSRHPQARIFGQGLAGRVPSRRAQRSS